MDITKLTLTELKAMAYDQLSLVELHQNNLRAISAEISKRKDEEPAKEVESAKEDNPTL